MATSQSPGIAEKANDGNCTTGIETIFEICFFVIIIRLLLLALCCHYQHTL